jgi:hypothetical protein
VLPCIRDIVEVMLFVKHTDEENPSMTTITGQLSTTTTRANQPAGSLSRWTMAAVLVGGATLQLVEELMEPPFANDGARFDWMAAHTTTHAVSVGVGLVAVPLLIAAVLLLGQRARRMPRLARAGVALCVVGFCGLAAVHGFEAAEIAVLDAGVPAATVANAAGSIQPALAVPLMAMFLGGLTIGLPLLMVALWRSRSVPRGAILVLFVFMLVDFAGPEMAFPSHGFSFIAFVWIAVAIVLDRSAFSTGQQ